MPLSVCLVDVLRPLNTCFLSHRTINLKKPNGHLGVLVTKRQVLPRLVRKTVGTGRQWRQAPPNSASHSAGSSRLSRDEVGPWETMGRARSRCCWDCHQVQLFLGPKWLYDSIAGSATAGSHPDAGIQSGVSACWIRSLRHKALGPHQHDGQPRGTGSVSGREAGQAERQDHKVWL